MEGDRKLCPDSGCEARGRGLEAIPFQGHPLETHFVNIQVSLAALVGFQTGLRKMTKKLVVYAISVYCDNPLFISSFLAII